MWERGDVASWDSEYEREFASIWRDIPKVVSTTLDRVDGNARLARSDPTDEVEALKAEFDGDLSVGGAGLASSLTKLGLIDEYCRFVCPVVLGGRTPYFEGATPLDLELLDTRPFGQGVIISGTGVPVTGRSLSASHPFQDPLTVSQVLKQGAPAR